MVKLQEPFPLFAIFIALIPLSRSDFFVTVTEDKAVQLEFPYPCESNKVTIQSANRAPFYNSAEREYLNLPFYQLNRFSVTDKNCSVQVDINPVKRSDEVKYICQAYRDGAIQSRFTRIRLKVNYPPGDVSCTLSIINDDAVGDWVPLQCTAPVGSMAGGIYCYQDSKRLPPMSKLVQIGENLKQTIWARKEYPVFCCSSSLNRPKDLCECNDFVWDPSDSGEILNPCHMTTAGQGVITKDPTEKSGDHLFSDTVNPYTLIPTTNTSNVKSSPLVWAGGIAILILVTALVIVTFYLCHVKKTNTNSLTEKKEGHPETHRFIKKQECGSQTSRKIPPILLNIDKARTKSSSWGYLRLDVDGIFSRTGLMKANSLGTLGK